MTTAVGMTPEEKSMLFTKFFRSDNWVIQETVGTGLGLVITRSLVEMQGGEVHVESSPGVGSVFSFTLPISPQALDRDLWKERSTRPIRSLAGKRILVVDDEPDIAELLRLCLERSGYDVLTALNAQEAVDVAMSERPDLITLDVLLPDQDGFAVLERLKGDAVTRGHSGGVDLHPAGRRAGRVVGCGGLFDETDLGRGPAGEAGARVRRRRRTSGSGGRG